VRAPEKDGLVWEGVTAEGQGITSDRVFVILGAPKKKKKTFLLLPAEVL
jgi:hypothetical protein